MMYSMCLNQVKWAVLDHQVYKWLCIGNETLDFYCKSFYNGQDLSRKKTQTSRKCIWKEPSVTFDDWIIHLFLHKVFDSPVRGENNKLTEEKMICAKKKKMLS